MTTIFSPKTLHRLISLVCILRHPCGGRVGTTPKVLGSFGTGTGGTASAVEQRRDVSRVERDMVMAFTSAEIKSRSWSRNSKWGGWIQSQQKSLMLLLSHGMSWIQYAPYWNHHYPLHHLGPQHRPQGLPLLKPRSVPRPRGMMDDHGWIRSPHPNISSKTKQIYKEIIHIIHSGCVFKFIEGEL